MTTDSARIAAVGTYLPVWGDGQGRLPGPDEDAVTLAVAAARAALGPPGGSGSSEPPERVVFVTRDLPLLEGGNGAALLAGIGLAPGTIVVEQVGGAAATLDAIADAEPGTLVVAADLAPAGAGAVLIGTTGPAATSAGRLNRSLPVLSRGQYGPEHDYADPRLLRERGVGTTLERLALPAKPDLVAGLPAKPAAALCAGRPPALVTLGASSPVFALAALDQVSSPALVLAIDQASASAISIDGVPVVHRDEAEAKPFPKLKQHPGPDIAISLAAYDRAFEPKLHWEAGRCDACGTLAFPPRLRCINCGSEAGWSLTALPRHGEVYTVVTIHIPVPGLRTPYSLAIVALDGVDVRALAPVTGVPAGQTGIGSRGRMVLRRVALRTGIPDYGYAFLPDSGSDESEADDLSASAELASSVRVTP
jgi:uncharacterized OB-fold protein